MARKQTISDDRLLDAARGLFIEKGVSGTTAEIAARAGVSEGTLFKRFGSKDRLFECAMHAETDFEGLLDAVSLEAPVGPVRVILARVGHALLERFTRIIPLALMHMAGAMSTDRMPLFDLGRPPPLRALDGLERLFRRLADEGSLSRAAAPEVLARVFLGPIWHFAFLDYVMARFAKVSAHPMTPRAFVEAHVDLLLEGARARDSAACGSQASPVAPAARRTRSRTVPGPRARTHRKGRDA